jgi:Skp family chaperone for outer membrane proteins
MPKGLSMRLLRLATIYAAFLGAFPSPAAGQTAPKPTEPVAPALAPAPLLFPVGVKFAFLDFQKVASDSVSGKLATRTLEEFRTKKLTEIEGQGKELQALTSRRDSGVLSGPALLQISKDVDKLQRAIQFSQQNAQAEIQQLQSELQIDFEKRVTPVVTAIAKEKGLHAVFAADPAIALYINPDLDISGEVIKRLDAQPKK